MTTNPMAAILARAEWPDPAFDAAAVGGWPAGALDALVVLGLLAAADPVTAAACDACGFDHVEPVQWVGGPGPDRRAFITCPSVGAVRLDPDELRRWVVRLAVLAGAVARAVGAAGGVAERVPGRVWKLGTVRVGGRAWIGFLAAGLTRPDSTAVVEAAPELRAANALVFVPFTTPSVKVWSADHAPVVVPLCDLLAFGPNGLVVDRDALTSAVTPGAGPVPKGPTRVFPTPPGTTWEQVAFTVEEHHVRVRIGELVLRFGFTEAGFEDRREKGTADEVWTLLGVLARFRGVLGSGDSITTKSGSLKQRVSTLRDRLRALLALADDPFQPTRRGQPYRARFTIQGDGAAMFPTPPGTTWDDITLTEITTGVEIGLRTETRGVAPVPAEEEKGGQWEGTTDRGTRQARYTFADLGLAASGHDLKPAGAALVAVLRGGGRLRRSADDPELLTLGDILTRFFQLDAPPFTFDAKRRVWIAQFDAASVVPASDR